MARIFLALALFAMLLLVSNLVLALTMGDFGAALRRYTSARDAWRAIDTSPEASALERKAGKEHFSQATAALNIQRRRFWPHIWLGIVAILVSLLVNCISVTYFIGTSRWCREVVEAYEMDSALAQRSQSLKRRTFPWALVGIVMLLLIMALGGASDVYSPAIRNPGDWVNWHMVVAMLGIVVIAISFLVQVGTVSANYQVINEIVAEANRMRSGAVEE